MEVTKNEKLLMSIF